MASGRLPGRHVSLGEWEKMLWSGEKDQAFVKETVNPLLLRFYDKMFDEGQKGRVFVPLCGISVDMVFLADKGHDVVGVECSRKAIERFFSQNDLTYSEGNVEGLPLVKFKADNKEINIYQGDLFELSPGICGKFDASWHVGSLEAINISTQQAYADLMARIVKPKSRHGLVTVDYDPTMNSGPPHFISIEEIRTLFGTYFNVEQMGIQVSKTPRHFKPGTTVNDRVTLLTRK